MEFMNNALIQMSVQNFDGEGKLAMRFMEYVDHTTAENSFLS